MKKSKKWTCFLLIAIIIVGIILNLPLNKVLVLTDIKTNRAVLYVKVRQNDYFVISFTHSINKGQVYDYIMIDGDNLTIFKSEFDSFGAGMPETSGNGIVVRHNEKGKVEVSGIKNTLPSIRLAVGTVANHFLIFHDKKIMLAELVNPGDSLLLSVTSISFIDLWRGRFWDE